MCSHNLAKCRTSKPKRANANWRHALDIYIYMLLFVKCTNTENTFWFDRLECDVFFSSFFILLIGSVFGSWNKFHAEWRTSQSRCHRPRIYQYSATRSRTAMTWQRCISIYIHITKTCFLLQCGRSAVCWTVVNVAGSGSDGLAMQTENNGSAAIQVLLLLFYYWICTSKCTFEYEYYYAYARFMLHRSFICRCLVAEPIGYGTDTLVSLWKKHFEFISTFHLSFDFVLAEFNRFDVVFIFFSHSETCDLCKG